MRITKEELLFNLKHIDEYCLKTSGSRGNQEMWHLAADSLLLAYIDDVEVERAFIDIPKWYS